MKVWIRTYGCRANQYDSEQVRAMVEGSGHTIVESASEADLAVFNSCAVTADAVADLRQGVRRAARENPGLRSVIMGCASAIDDGLQSLPTVERLVAGGEPHEIARAIGVERLAPAGSQSGARALLRIQDGCDEHCTFCATTLARGANRSRPISELIDEAEVLSDRHAEIVVTGIHIGTYGRDVGSSLGELMTEMIGEVPSSRFRLTSIEATEVDATLLDLMARCPERLVPHIHAPLQSGSDRVLKRMGRHWYTAASYATAIERMAERLPVFGLGADIITGFPGETEEDHAATVALVDALPFTYLHVFPYSERPGTAALRLGDRVQSSVAQRRAKELRAIGERKAAAYAGTRAGQEADVIVVGRGRGLTEDYLEIDVAGLGRGERARIRLSS
jgi:threonylcarbamoyladenosine tRNA methylthiotransferase MtaB